MGLVRERALQFAGVRRAEGTGKDLKCRNEENDRGGGAHQPVSGSHLSAYHVTVVAHKGRTT